MEPGWFAFGGGGCGEIGGGDQRTVDDAFEEIGGSWGDVDGVF